MRRPGSLAGYGARYDGDVVVLRDRGGCRAPKLGARRGRRGAISRTVFPAALSCSAIFCRASTASRADPSTSACHASNEPNPSTRQSSASTARAYSSADSARLPQRPVAPGHLRRDYLTGTDLLNA